MARNLLSIVCLAVCYATLPTGAVIIQSSSNLAATYDFIVVGGGAAGSVVANRLSENPAFQVLIIEAGPLNDDISLEQPFLWINTWGTQYDWNYTTVAQASLDDRIITFPSGHVLGGSTSIHGSSYTRGSSDDYNRIAEITGDDGWSWTNLQPYFQRNERWTEPPDNHDTTGQFDPSAHGYDGVLSVSLPGYPRSIDQRVMESLQDGTEFPFNLDHNSGNTIGVGWAQFTVTHNARRDSAATSYLGPQFISRPNLHILLNTRVTRVLESTPKKFNKVEFAEIVDGVPGPLQALMASKDVILSAGAIATPSILLHSGIGDQVALEALGITPTHHLPSVGQNLTDHVGIGAAWLVDDTDTYDTIFRDQVLMDQYLEEWEQFGTGPFAGGVTNALGALRLPNDASIFNEYPDTTAGPNSGHYELLFTNGLLLGTPPTGNYISVGATLLSPASRGTLTINSADPFSSPVIDLGLLSHEFDQFTAREGLRAIVRFLDQPAWDGYILEPTVDIAAFNDDELDAYIRGSAGAGLHVVSSASMSPKNASWGVTDPDLKVKGASNLRIVDASVIVEWFIGFTMLRMSC
ncbi:hypothetical protein ONZ45_g1834 [Pleurotus djamor]|nr:hypothetical protein ONZ45_g1834 [Pleurotus djamor]